MKTREKITLDDTQMSVIIKMAEDNPGAVKVCAEILKARPDPQGLFILLGLDDMGIRGAQLWVAYKDFCQCDVEKLIASEAHRDAAMVLAVNAECPPPEYPPAAQYGNSPK